jgi:hypothetical protein
VVSFGLALWAVHHVLREHSSGEIAAALRELSAPRIALSRLGFLALGAAAFISEPILLPAGLRLPPTTTRPLGFAFLALLCGYALLVTRRRREFPIRRWTLSLPSPALRAAQLAVGPPVRFGSQPELTLITLVRAAPKAGA